MSQPVASVVITTKDRKSELERAVASVLAQRGNLELIVFDDGSADGTSQMMRERFPGVRLVRSEKSLGIIGARNRAIPLAASEIVVVIDDDCVLTADDIVLQAVAGFDRPEIGAVAIPHVNAAPHSAWPLVPPIPVNLPPVVSEFTGCAMCLRKQVFLDLGGFRTVYWRQCEEYDYCTRLLEHGYFVRGGRSTPILHLESLHRERAAIWRYAARNHLLYAWLNVPWPEVLGHVPATLLNMIAAGAKTGHTRSVASGFWSAVSYACLHRNERTPVGRKAYARMRALRRKSHDEPAA